MLTFPQIRSIYEQKSFTHRLFGVSPQKGFRGSCHGNNNSSGAARAGESDSAAFSRETVKNKSPFSTFKRLKHFNFAGIKA